MNSTEWLRDQRTGIQVPVVATVGVVGVVGVSLLVVVAVIAGFAVVNTDSGGQADVETTRDDSSVAITFLGGDELAAGDGL